MFVKYGYKKTTTEMLADEAGISKALLFHHFKSKKKIYFSILEHVFEKMSLEIPEEPLTEYKDYFDARVNSGYNKVDYLRNNPKANKMMVEAFHNTPDELKEDINKFSLKLKEKYGDVEEKKEIVMKKLFNELNLRKDVDESHAYELISIVTQYFRKRVAIDLTDSDKIYDEKYWKNFFDKRKEFLNMIRYGIEKKNRSDIDE